MLEHPIIKELLILREKQFAAIKRQGGWNDAYGNFISIEGRDAKSVFATLMQSIEFRIAQSVFDVAIKDGERLDFKIIAWQHDGWLMKVSDKRKEEQIKKLLGEAIDAAAKRFNVQTEIEYTQL
jgi:hypothetical protein